MMLGIDIGGVATKVSIFQESGRRVAHFRLPYAVSQNWDFWATWFDQWMATCPLLMGTAMGAVLVSISAELSDAFVSKEDGVHRITRALDNLFGNSVRMVTHMGELVTTEKAREHVWHVAAANWIPTAQWIGRHAPTAIMVDIGSTTTDIIPIVNGRPDPVSRCDMGRLQSSELVYLGIERTPVNSLAHRIPWADHWLPVAGELFAQTGDVWRVVGLIDQRHLYHTPVDGRTWSLTDCYRRLAKIICADLSQATPQALKSVAWYLAEQQMRITYNAIFAVERRSFAGSVPIYVVGQGAKCLARYGQRRGGPKLLVWSPHSECWSSDALAQYLPQTMGGKRWSS